MITYVDTSTLIKLVVVERGTDRAAAIWAATEVATAATIITVEARAAVAAALRAGRLTVEEHRAATLQLHSLLGGLTTVDVTRELITEAAHLAEAEALRAYDAVHLAAARLVRADVLTSADRALCDAASRRGLRVANPVE